jgi:cytoskeletal protein CcmA (bactofilin family)
VADIGKSITIRGDLSGDEDLVLDGRIEGRVELSDHHLTIGPNAHIQAELAARGVTINGRVVGNVTATERVEIGASGRLDGDIVAPRLLVQEGAQLNGSVNMKEPSALASATKTAEKAPTEKSAPKAPGPPPGGRPPEPQATL